MRTAESVGNEDCEQECVLPAAEALGMMSVLSGSAISTQAVSREMTSSRAVSDSLEQMQNR